MGHPYLLPGLEVPAMRGRRTEFAQLCGGLAAADADHVSIVAPRYFGKTVMLHALAGHFSAPGSPYRVVSFWDLRHRTPKTDAEFERNLAKRIDDALRLAGITDLSTLRTDGAGDAGMQIGEVLDAAAARGISVLMLLDDFDALAGEANITKDLWDRLRDLAERPNFRLAVSSRRRLRDLIPSRESRASDFWNVFGTTLQLRPIAPDQFADFAEPLAAGGYRFDAAACDEIYALTGGVPVLVAATCRAIMAEVPPGPVAKAELDRIAAGLTRTTRDILADLWDDCGHEAQGDLIDLNADATHCDAIPPRRCEVLVDRGYLVQQDGKLQASCRLIADFSALEETLAGDLRELFRDPPTEERNFKAILRNKLAQVNGGDPEIRGFVSLAIDALKRDTHVSLVLIRSIAEHAVQVAWLAEFPTGVIPQDIQDKLSSSFDRFDRGLEPRLLSHPDDLHARQTILRRAVGIRGSPKVTRKVSRPAMLLIDYLHSLGNFGQHMNSLSQNEERPVDFTFCVSACFAALALLERLAEDLG